VKVNISIELNLNEKSIEYLNTLSCFPKELTGKIDTIYPVFKSIGKNKNSYIISLI
jgi:hypothetical protein